MNELEEFVSVVRSLSINEFKDIQNKLSSQRGKSDNNLSLKLFDLVYNQIDNKAQKIQFSLYGSGNPPAFKKLISRVLEKILDVLLIKENIDQSELYDERTRNIFLLERKLIISEILRYRGLFNISNQSLEKVITQSKYYEHYDILLYALEKKRRWVFTNLSEKENEQLSKEIEFYNSTKNELKLSSELYLKIIKLNVESYDLNKKKYIAKSITKLKRFYNINQSSYINYYLFYLKVQFHNFSFEYSKSIQNLDELIEFILRNKNIYSKHRHGNALLNRGLFYRYKFEFESSVQNINDARKYILDRKQNNIIIYEQLFLTYYYWGDISKVKYYLQLIEREISNDGYKYFDKDKFHLFVSVYNLIIQKFDKSLSSLREISKSNNSILFNVNYKILFIIIYIETNRLDLADSNIESLRKYISRISINEKLIKRKQLIMKILGNLSVNSYNFEAVEIHQQNNLQELKEMSNSFRFFDYEMILFHEWFESKVKKIPYDHVDVMARLRKVNKSRHIK